MAHTQSNNFMNQEVAAPTPTNQKKRLRDDSSDDLDGMSRDSFEPKLNDKQKAFMAKTQARQCAKEAREMAAKLMVRAKTVLDYVLKKNDRGNQLGYYLRTYFSIDNRVGCIVKHKSGSGSYELIARADEHKYLVAEVRKQFTSARAGKHPSRWTLAQMHDALAQYAHDRNVPY
jgi:predicted secreted protein